MSDTPETDAFYDKRFESSATWEERFKDACDFARNLERQRNMLLYALESLLEMGACVTTDDAIIENKMRQKIAREAIASVKQTSPYVGEESWKRKQ